MIEIEDIQEKQSYIAIYNAQLHNVEITRTFSEFMSIMAGAEGILLQAINSNGETFNVSQENLFHDVRSAYIALVHQLNTNEYYAVVDDQIIEMNIQTDDFSIDVDELCDLPFDHILIEQLNHMDRQASIVDTDEIIVIQPTNIYEYRMEAFEKLMNKRITSSDAINVQLISDTKNQTYNTLNSLVNELLINHSKEVVEDILANRHRDYRINYIINETSI